MTLIEKHPALVQGFVTSDEKVSQRPVAQQITPGIFPKEIPLVVEDSEGEELWYAPFENPSADVLYEKSGEGQRHAVWIVFSKSMWALKPKSSKA